MPDTNEKTWTPVTQEDWASHEATKPYDESAERARLIENGQNFIDVRVKHAKEGAGNFAPESHWTRLDPLRVGMWLRLRGAGGTFAIAPCELDLLIKDGEPVPRQCTCSACWGAHQRANDAEKWSEAFDQTQLEADRTLLRSLLIDRAGLNRMLAYRAETDAAYKPLGYKLAEVERKIAHLESAASARRFLRMREDVWLA